MSSVFGRGRPIGRNLARTLEGAMLRAGGRLFVPTHTKSICSPRPGSQRADAGGMMEGYSGAASPTMRGCARGGIRADIAGDVLCQSRHRFYSITSSAIASNLSGTVRSSALAATSSKRVGCSMGISAGLVPRRTSCQGWGRAFESHRPLQTDPRKISIKTVLSGMAFRPRSA
jgi:hypothetical protein